MEPNTGGGNPGGIGHHCLGDFTIVTPGLPVHNLLCLQVLSGQEEKARPIYNLKIPMSTCHKCLGYTRQHSEKAPLMILPPSPCQTLEVPLRPDFELAFEPPASDKAKSWVQVFPCNKNCLCSPRLCPRSMLGALGLLGRN